MLHGSAEGAVIKLFKSPFGFWRASGNSPGDEVYFSPLVPGFERFPFFSLLKAFRKASSRGDLVCAHTTWSQQGLNFKVKRVDKYYPDSRRLFILFLPKQNTFTHAFSKLGIVFIYFFYHCVFTLLCSDGHTSPASLR